MTPDTVTAGNPMTPLREDIVLKMAQPYNVQMEPDEYRCFVIPWDANTTKFVTGFQVKPGNASIVHHVIVDIVAPGDMAAIKAQDGNDGKPGFACGQNGASLNWLGAWAPGGVGTRYGTGVGVTVGTRLDPGMGLVLQMHYHAEGDLSKVTADQTAVALEVADKVDREGNMVIILDPKWSQGNMLIPANDPNVVHSYVAGASTAVSIGSFVGGPDITLPKAIYGVSAHMHTRGSVGYVGLVQNNQDVCLLDIPAWNFNWQNGYSLTTPVMLTSADQINVTCHWDNTAAHQPLINGKKATPTDLNWGEGTNDEMCIGFLYLADPP